MTVLEAVQNSKSIAFMYKGAIKAAQKMLSPSEDILWAVTGNVASKPVYGELDTDFSYSADSELPGVIVVTDQRILFVHHVMGQGTSKEIPLSAIRSIDTKKSIQLDAIRIVGISDMIVMKGNRKPITNLRNAINEALSRRITPKPTAPAQASDEDALLSSDIEQLQALKQLYDTGVITAEEFAAKKAQILNL